MLGPRAPSIPSQRFIWQAMTGSMVDMACSITLGALSLTVSPLMRGCCGQTSPFTLPTLASARRGHLHPLDAPSPPVWQAWIKIKNQPLHWDPDLIIFHTSTIFFFNFIPNLLYCLYLLICFYFYCSETFIFIIVSLVKLVVTHDHPKVGFDVFMIYYLIVLVPVKSALIYLCCSADWSSLSGLSH